MDPTGDLFLRTGIGILVLQKQQPSGDDPETLRVFVQLVKKSQ
jgi:hypothetical protein